MQLNGRVFVVFAIMWQLAVVVSAQCPEGCDGASESLTADSGLPYMNSCVARCQGSQVLTSRTVGMQLDQRPASESVILAHAAQGYHFVNFGRVKRVKATLRGSQQAAVSAPATLKDIPLDRVIMYDVSNGGVYATAVPAKLPAAASVDYAAVAGAGGDAYTAPQQPATQSPAPAGTSEMLNPELTVDIKPSPSPAAATDSTLVTPPLMDVGNVGGRRLLASRKLQTVQTPDERVEVAAQPSDLPLSPVGQLMAHGQQWHCSASLIGDRTIITAAHCVFDRATGSFAKGLYFIPGRFRDSTGKIQAPFGGFDVAEVYIMSQYVSGAPQDIWASDMAVVQLVETAQIGKVVGRLGISAQAAAQQSSKTVAVVAEKSADIRATSAARKTRVSRNASPAGAATPNWQGTLATAGYPSDKPEGTLVTTSCAAEQYVTNSASNTPGATLKLKCSTHLGQSGSPLINAQNQVQGVISFEVAGNDGYNGGCAVTAYLWENLIKPNLV